MDAPPSTPTFEVDVDEDQVASFREDGYLAIDRITTDEEVEWLRGHFDDIFERRDTGITGAFFDTASPYDSTGPDLFAQAIMPELARPELRQTQFVRNGRRIASKLMDVPEDQLQHWGHMLRKPARIGHAAPWHQDEAYWDPENDYHAVGSWMPLDDADIDNGCLWFLPGSHRLPVLAHKHEGDDPTVHILELVDPIDTSAAVPVPTKAGGASFHHPRTLHFSRPNSTDRARRAYANEFQTAPVRRDVPADRPTVDHRGAPSPGRGHRAPAVMMGPMFDHAASNPALVDPTIDARAVSFESPGGERGAGGQAAGGRKGRPNKVLRPDERVVLGDMAGPGMVRHIWLTVPSAPPAQLRSLILEVFYDGADEPSVSVPVVDFFGAPHGRPVDYTSELTSILEGRGFTSYLPMPFRERIRFELWNSAEVRQILYYQIDYTLQPELPDDLGLLHVTFRRENPTTIKEDFVIAGDLRGPGRFLGCNVGVRIIDHADWYGEGEVKVYRDGDTDFPTICGTGLEDYVGSAWGLGRFHSPHSGAPLIVAREEQAAAMGTQPDLVGFYRWHLLDPIMFERELRVTIQQIGAMGFAPGQEAALEAYQQTNPAAGNGWLRDLSPALLAWGIAERVDDYCATAYVYCTEAQPVPRVDPVLATADIDRFDYESMGPTELLALSIAGSDADLDGV